MMGANIPSVTRLIIFVCLITSSQSLFETHECLNLHDGITITDVFSKCKGHLKIGGAGYIDLTGSAERTIETVFSSVRHLHMGIKLYRDEKLQVLNLANLEEIKGKGEMGSVWIENTMLENILTNLTNSSLLKVTGGAFIRGNRYLNQESLDLIKYAIPEKKPRWIQSVGECNIDIMGFDFTNCTAVNNLILPDGYTIPDHFRPIQIAGCLFVRDIQSDHNFLENINLANMNQLRCSLDVQQAIEDNEVLCIKDMEPLLSSYGRKFKVERNGNSTCRFKCNRMDFMKKQRWCETYDTTIIIDNEFLTDLNITDFLMHLKVVTGGIVISNIGSVDFNITVLEELVFPELQFVGGSSFLDDVIFVHDTMLTTLKFPRLVSVRGGERAVTITPKNPYLKMTFMDVANLQIAANGRPVLIPENYTLPEGVETEYELKQLQAEEEEDANTTEEPNIGAIVGGSVGGGVGLILLVVVVLVVAIVVVRKKKSSLKKKKKGGKGYSKVAKDSSGELEKGENTGTVMGDVPKSKMGQSMATSAVDKGAITAPLLSAGASDMKSPSKMRSPTVSGAKTPNTSKSGGKKDKKNREGKSGDTDKRCNRSDQKKSQKNTNPNLAKKSPKSPAKKK